ncbi:MAG: hypothetical protein INF92_04960 [Rhodobacter sp.]|nr:hypothetical protein [Rhodobacter sp.]
MNKSDHRSGPTQPHVPFVEEWSQIQEIIQSEMRAVLVDHGATQQLLRYVAEMKGYPRVPCFAAAWIENPSERAHHATCHCLHAVGIKLLDDVIDQDQEVSNADLALGHVLIQHALARLPADAAELDFALRAWRPIWAHIVREPQTALQDIDAWFSGAEIKAGRMMEFYARLSSRTAMSLTSPEEQTARAMNLVGQIYMVGDDIRDWHVLGERRSNLFEMIAGDERARQSVRARLDAMSGELGGILALYPPALDFAPEVARIADKWHRALTS